MSAKLALTFRGWIDHAKNITLLGAIAAGCVYGYAFAIGPTIDTNRTFGGAINLAYTTEAQVVHPIYTVPAGKQYTLTDVIITDLGSAGVFARVSISDDSNCSSTNFRLNDVRTPAGGTLHLPLVTGLGFGSGKHVCIWSSPEARWTMRGYLSN